MLIISNTALPINTTPASCGVEGLIPQYMREHRDHCVARRNRREGDRDGDFLESRDIAKRSHDIDCEADYRSAD